MVMNEKEVREECVKLAELSSRLLRQHNDLEKIVAGAQKKEELLLDYIDNICGIIEAEMPLKEQDLWLEDCIKMGFYNPFPSPKAKINNCIYCDKVNIISSHFKMYVCNDCYDKKQEEKKSETK